VRGCVLVVFTVGWLGCGRQPLMQTVDWGADGATATSGSDAAAESTARVPRKHRAAGAPCPAARGAGSLPVCPPGGVPGSASGNCSGDADCTEGLNGRCNPPLFGPSRGCQGLCSYDQCLDDSGCGSSVPCECRDSEASPANNACETASSCRVDADCGASGFCSPSLVGAACQCGGSPDLCDSSTHCFAGSMEVPCSCGDVCGHGYYCHTPGDACLDDEDCDKGEYCSYDRLKKRWSCSGCYPVP
jgi:hypothetical protein